MVAGVDTTKLGTARARSSKPEGVATVDHSTSEAGSPQTDGEMHAVPLANLLSAERSYRRTVLDRIRARVDAGHGVRGPRIQGSTRGGSEDRRAPVESRKNVLGQLTSISPEVLAAFIPLAEPVNLANGLHEIRQAASLAHLHPERIREARAKLLIGLSEVSSFAYAASSLTHPFGVLAATILTSGIKLLNAAYKVITRQGASDRKDPMVEGAARVSDMPVMRTALNVLLKVVHTIDNQVARALDPLKNNFSFGVSPRERQLGDKLLDRYVALHNECFPDREISTASLRESLLDPSSEGEVCVVKGGDGIVGGFSCYLFQEAGRPTILQVSSVVPPKSFNAADHEQVWRAVLEYAEVNGAQYCYLVGDYSETARSSAVALPVR